MGPGCPLRTDPAPAPRGGHITALMSRRPEAIADHDRCAAPSIWTMTRTYYSLVVAQVGSFSVTLLSTEGDPCEDVFS